MRKICTISLAMFLCVNALDAFGATRNSVSADTPTRSVTRTKTENLTRSTTSRTATKNIIPRSTTSRAATNVTGRGTTTKTTVSRSGATPTRISRAATNIQTRTFGANYNTCRDAYFTCMDQFCATQNETYRRCVCSSKLQDIQSQEKLLYQTSETLKDFETINIDAISKNAAEIRIMSSETDGERAIKTDTSPSATTLNNISSVYNSSKKQSLSTAGKLDAGGDIKSIWNTTNLIGGSEIAELTGENLFNSVHAQCYELATSVCGESDLKMVASAYGMYIENDCAIIENNLKTKKIAANESIRQTRHKMQDARLENYDAHNSVTINECIANVRRDILQDTSCGANYVHCLDFSGKYLNMSTGEPIYSPDFYQIENQISLSGDVLKNKNNSYFVSMLNQKRSFAQKNLDLCRDNADDVWNEFLRQALVEIYQGQQARVKQVKDECLQVVNQCYADKSGQLSGLTDGSSAINAAQTLELSEEMCADKLNTCSNLYGGGPEGLDILIATMTGITDATIAQSCPELLTAFAQKICAVPDNDSAHSYPYGCRKYAPGESIYARNEVCNTTFVNPFSRSEILTAYNVNESSMHFSQMCIAADYSKKYTSCKPNYYLYNPNACGDGNSFCFSKDTAIQCLPCPNTAVCSGGTAKPVSVNQDLYDSCGEYYIGSLYQQFAVYALQNCTRPSDNTNVISEYLLTQIEQIIQKIRTSLISELATECDNQGGEWVNIPWIDANMNGRHDQNYDSLHVNFYVITGANTLWGYCRQP